MKKWIPIVLLAVACAITTRAYVQMLNSSGNFRKWNFVNPPVGTNVFNPTTHAIRYFLASDGWSGTNTAAELNAVRASFGQWQAVPNTVIKYEDAGLVAPGYDVNSSD